MPGCGGTSETVRDYRGETVLETTDEWQPRLGVVWDPKRDGKTKIYAFAGRFYYALPTNLVVRVYGNQHPVETFNFDPVSVITTGPSSSTRCPTLRGALPALLWMPASRGATRTSSRWGSRGSSIRRSPSVQRDLPQARARDRGPLRSGLQPPGNELQLVRDFQPRLWRPDRQR